MMYTLRTVDARTSFFYGLATLGLPYFTVLGLNLATGLTLINRSGKIKRRVSKSKMTKPRLRRSNEVKATITILLMVVVFTITVMPALILVSVYTSIDAKYYESKLFGVWSNVCSRRYQALPRRGIFFQEMNSALILLLVSNSAWNFIIYSWRYHWKLHPSIAIITEYMRLVSVCNSLTWHKYQAVIFRLYYLVQNRIIWFIAAWP